MAKVGRINSNRQLVFFLLLSLGFILIALLIGYFYFFPTLSSPLFTDILLVLVVLLLLSTFVYASIKANSTREVILTLVGIMFLSILARSIPHLRLVYPPFHDPYYYYISTLNITEWGTLQPVLGDWYYGVNVHLHWPMMNLFTAALARITEIDAMWFLRFQEPLLGGIFALIVFALAKEITKNDTIALLSALCASVADVVISYQSEYHPQGFTLIFLVLFLYLYLKSRTPGRFSYRVLALVCLIAFLLSHHFSSLFVALLAISVIVVSYLVSILPQRVGQITGVSREFRAEYSLWLIIAVAGLAYHFMLYFSPLRDFLKLLIEKQPSATLLIVGAPVPMLVTVLNTAKWGIFALAVFSMVKVIRTPRPHEFRLLVLLASILLAGFIGTYIAWAPVDRFIVFYIPLVSVFAAKTLHELFTLRQVSLHWTRVIKAATVFIAGLLLTANFFNGICVPAFYFKSSQANVFYWYYNRLPPMELHKAAGEWLGEYTPEQATIGIQWDTRITPFFYGRKPWGNTYDLSSTSKFDYALVSSAMPPEYTKHTSFQVDPNLDLVYNNGELVVYLKPLRNR